LKIGDDMGPSAEPQQCTFFLKTHCRYVVYRAAREYYDRPVTNFLPDGSLNPDRFIGQKKTAGLARVPA
jgi:hypothetical protein